MSIVQVSLRLESGIFSFGAAKLIGETQNKNKQKKKLFCLIVAASLILVGTKNIKPERCFVCLLLQD